MRLVLVEWVDSLGPGGTWAELTDLPPEIAICRSVGWLLHDTDACKVLVPHVIEAAPQARAKRQGAGDMTIPTAAIRRIVDLPDPTSPDPT